MYVGRRLGCASLHPIRCSHRFAPTLNRQQSTLDAFVLVTYVTLVLVTYVTLATTISCILDIGRRKSNVGVQLVNSSLQEVQGEGSTLGALVLHTFSHSHSHISPHRLQQV